MDETGLGPELLCDLLLKNLYRHVTATGAERAAELGLPFAGVVEPLIESLRGSRERLRGIGLNQETLDILGIKHAGIGQ